MARRSARRRWGPPAAAVAITAWLVAVLGSERVIDSTAEADRSLRPLFRSLTGHAAWSGDQVPADLEWALAAKVGTLLVGVAVLAWLAASAGSRMTAFLAGWTASVVSSAVAGLVFVVAGNAVRPEVSSDDLVTAVSEANQGAVFGLYTGWLVGLAIAAVVVPTPRPEVMARPADAAATPPAGRKAGRRKGRRGRTPEAAAPEPASPAPAPSPVPVATWPPRPPIGTVLPNPAWTAAGHRQEPGRPPLAPTGQPPWG